MADTLKSTATLTAKIDAALRGSERGLLILACFFLILFFGSLASIMYTPTAIGYAGGVIGLLGGPALFFQWYRIGELAYGHDAANTSMAATSDSFQITTPLATVEEKITMVREVLHGRKPPPAPYGSATENRPYSEAERAQIVRETEEAVKAHDTRLLHELEQIAPVLPKRSSDEPAGAPQAVVLEDRRGASATER